MTIKLVFSFVCIIMTSSIKIAQAVDKSCAYAPCNITTCSDTSTKCNQLCSVTPCKTSCSSPGGCDAKCPLGGCSRMTCTVKARSPTVPVSISKHRFEIFNSFFKPGFHKSRKVPLRLTLYYPGGTRAKK